MALHLPSKVHPGAFNFELQNTNGRQPSPVTLRTLADGLNTVALYQTKLLAMRGQWLATYDDGGAGGTSVWPFYFRSGEGRRGVRFVLGLIDSSTSATSPHVDITIRDRSGATVASGSVYHNARDSGTPWDGNSVLNRTHLATKDLVGLSADTEYTVEIEAQDYIAIAFMCALEIGAAHADDSINGIVDPSKFVVGGPIYDEHWQDLLDAGSRHWRHSGCHYLSWAGDWGATSLPVASYGSYTNVIDGTSTTVSAATPGVVLASENHHTATTDPAVGSPVKMAVKARRTVGSGSLSVRLNDGTNVISVTGITTGGVDDWYTVTATLPSSLNKWDIQAVVTSGTFELDAVCLFAYSA